MSFWIWSQESEFLKRKERQSISNVLSSWNISCSKQELMFWETRASLRINCMISAEQDCPLLIISTTAILSELMRIDLDHLYPHRIAAMMMGLKYVKCRWQCDWFWRDMNSSTYLCNGHKAYRGHCISVDLNITWMSEKVAVVERYAIPQGTKMVRETHFPLAMKDIQWEVIRMA